MREQAYLERALHTTLVCVCVCVHTQSVCSIFSHTRQSSTYIARASSLVPSLLFPLFFTLFSLFLRPCSLSSLSPLILLLLLLYPASAILVHLQRTLDPFS